METLTQVNDLFDRIEVGMTNFENVECPLSHKFVGGIYVREILMPAGTLVASKIHKTEHPFIVSKGEVLVRVNGGEWQRIVAPYSGITYPGTRRLLYIIEDTLWGTYHVTQPGETTPEQVEDRIILKHKHPYIELRKEVEDFLCRMSQPEQQS